MSEGFEPKITAFVCNWCTYAGADLTGTSRIKYQSNVRVLRVPCTGRIDFMLVMKALERGADGVMISGCHPNDCHYTSGNYHARSSASTSKARMRSGWSFPGCPRRRVPSGAAW